MKKALLLVAVICLFGVLSACGSGVSASSGVTTDYPAAMMVEDTIYLLHADPMSEEIDESVIAGYITSYTNEFPQKNGETNFSRELNLPYLKVSDGIAVLYENKWHLCTPNE